MNAQDAPSPFAATLKGRCPSCGEGRLFAGYLKLADECSHCGLDLEKYDQADGPAVFVMFIVGFLVVVPAAWVELSFMPPLWLHVILWTPWTIFLSLLFLRPFKALLVAVQFKTKAAEARFDD